jgi:uncharacterized Zn-binding protein involved in type VI secretion
MSHRDNLPEDITGTLNELGIETENGIVKSEPDSESESGAFGPDGRIDTERGGIPLELLDAQNIPEHVSKILSELGIPIQKLALPLEELDEEYFTDKLMEQRMLGGPGAGGKHFVHRLGDYCTGHGCYPPRQNVSSSPNVWSDNIKVHRKGDSWAIHCCPPPCHGSSTCTGAPTVFANNKEMARQYDSVCCGSLCRDHSDTVHAWG